jgi:hypothetical protein
MYKRILQSLVKNFFVTKGRAPSTAMEWAKLRARARALAGETPDVTSKTTQADLLSGPHISRGDPKGDRIWDFSKNIPTRDVQSRTADIIPFPRGIQTSQAVKGLMRRGDVTVGKAPKTTQGILDAKKDRHILLRDSEEGIARIKSQNREAIKRFKEKNPDKFQYGGIAPLVGEPSYAADFYDDRTPMKKGKKAKKKKKTVAALKKELVEDLIKQGVPVEVIKTVMRKLPRPWERLPHGQQRYYRGEKDLPEGILELLQKDPGFDMEAFKDTYWAGKGWRHTDPGWSEGMRGSYSPMTGAIELNLAPFGEKEYTKFRAKSPHLPDRFLTDTDKAKIALHELRHKNIMEDQNLFKTQPEWVQRSEGAGYLPKGGVTGHELYNRFLDKRYYPPEEDPGPNDPYFDKILKDHWEPYAQDYEKTAKRRLSERHGEGIETLAAQGGRIGLAGGGALFKFIEKLFIKASNDIRQGKGKWKGLDQKQRIVQHDNLTKKVTEFQKTGKLPEGTEQYFGVNPNEAFAAAKTKATGKLSQKAEVEAQRQEQIMKEAYDEIAGGSGFSGDYKYDADILADSIAEVQGKVYTDLPDLERTGIYDQALKRVTKDLKSKMDFKKNLKDVEQKIELQMFDPKDRLPNQSGGPVDQEALIQMYLEEGLSYDEAVAAAQAASGLDMDILKDEKAKGGRAGYIFGGSAGLKAMWKQMLKTISKGKDKPVKRLFPTLSAEERAMEKVVMGTPEQKAFREGDTAHRVEGIEILINRLKHDKKILERRAKNKAMKDPNLDFLTKHLEETVMPEVYGPHLKKYTDIDKDVLQLENIKKNLIMKDRKLNAEGGRIGYAGGGQTGLPAVTMGLPQGPAMQQPQMPAGPQPAGIPGGTIVAQNQMQQSPWMGPQMNQGIGGMPQRGMPQRGMPQRGMPQRGQPRMPFGLGSMSRRAFLKMMAAAGTLPFIGKGISKVAPKAIKETTEVITRGADGMPSYIYDLIEVVKAKGTRDIIEGFKKSDYSTVHSYKGVDVIEDPLGNIKIKNDRSGMATDSTTGKLHEGIAEERHMQIERGQMNVKDEGLETQKGFQEPDEYIEGTVRPDREGKMKDFEEGLDEDAHEFFKKIADEIDTLTIKKASGGLARMLGE